MKVCESTIGLQGLILPMNHLGDFPWSNGSSYIFRLASFAFQSCIFHWLDIVVTLKSAFILLWIWSPFGLYLMHHIFIMKFIDETLQCREKKITKKKRATLGTTSCTPALGLTFFFFNQILIVLISCYCNGVYEY